MYGKLFESTFTGSMYGSGPVVFAVWGYVVAHTKPPGRVEVNPRAVAAALGCKPEEVQKAMKLLMSPDKESRSKEHEGCRLLKRGEFLYDVPSWPKYQAMRNDDERRQYNAEKMRASRARRKPKKADVTQPVNDSEQSCTAVCRCVPPCASASAHADAHAESEKIPPPRRSGAPVVPASRMSTMHLSACKWFGERFQAERGAPYRETSRDRAEAHRLLVKEGIAKDEWKRRAEIMLKHSWQGHFEKASPAHLAANWNAFAVEVVPLTKAQKGDIDVLAEWNKQNGLAADGTPLAQEQGART